MEVSSQLYTMDDLFQTEVLLSIGREAEWTPEPI
jgi:hypothetical protein